jgi:glutathione S-transferase
MMLSHKQISYRTIFLEFPDIKPTLEALFVLPISSNFRANRATSGIPPHDPSKAVAYTVPAISIPSRKTLLMDSAPIAQYLETTYPSPPLPLTSDLGIEIESKSRAQLNKILQFSVTPREIRILSPRAQEFFRRTREPWLGDQKLETVLEGEDEVWKSAEDSLREVGSLLLTNKARGPFVLGEQVSYTDFFIVGAMQCMRVVDEELWERICKYPGFREIYEACAPLMGKKD